MNQSLLIGRYDDAEIEVIDTSHALAAHLCLFAILIRILFSPALLGTLGIAYEGDTGGSFISKIHPSSYLIILSFLLLIVRNENPVRNIIEIMQQNKILSGVIVVYALLTAYWAARNPSGVGIMLETHMMAPICALVLSYAPRSLCRRALYMFVAVTVINSSIGVGESIFKQRIFPYDDTVVFVKEEIFRSSALLGHPLNNAMFTSVMLPLAMILPMPKLLKGSVLLVILASLVAFGGRAGLIFSVLGLLPVGINHLRQTMINKKTTLLQLIITLATVILLPVVICGFLYALLSSGIGERIFSMSNFHDDSAGTRILAFRAIDYMTDDELLFGTSSVRVIDITHRMGLTLPLTDIENPWVLMFMFLGSIMFPIWLAAMVAFIVRLMHSKAIGVKVAVLSYLFVASGSNSFGRKELIYTIMAALVICAERAGVGRVERKETL